MSDTPAHTISAEFARHGHRIAIVMTGAAALALAGFVVARGGRTVGRTTGERATAG